MRILSSLKKPISISKNFIVFLLFFTFLTFVISLIIGFKNYNQTQNSINQRLQYQSERIENKMADAIGYGEHSMSFIARQIADNHKEKDYNFINRLLISYRVLDDKIMEYSTFAWANENYRYIISSNKGFHFDQNLDLSKRDYIARTVSNPLKIQLGKPVFGIFSKKYSVPFGYGVVDKKNKYLGAVISSFVIDGLQKKLHETISNEGIYFVLLQKDGAPITSSPSINFSDINQLIKKEWHKINDSKKGILYEYGLLKKDQKTGSVYYNKLENYPYVILTMYNQDLQKAELCNMVLNHIMVFIALLFLITILLFFFHKILVKPIIILADAANKISDGNQNIDVGRCSSIEINQLSKAILSIKEFVRKDRLLQENLLLNKKLKALTKSVNHDLRNYISGILGLADIIAEDKDLSKEDSKTIIAQDQEYAAMIASQAKIMLKFSESLMTDEGIESRSSGLGKRSVKEDFEDVDIGQLIKELIELKKPFIKEHEVNVKFDISKNLPTLKTNLIELRKILDNLITNAIKYSPKNSNIVVRASRAETQIEIEIIDNGIGMSKEDIAKALAGNGKSIDKSGLDKEIDSHGIGLPIVKQAVENLDAKMEIFSEKGKGTKIKLWFNTNCVPCKAA
jgi:signal transduction histidine kinase